MSWPTGCGLRSGANPQATCRWRSTRRCGSSVRRSPKTCSNSADYRGQLRKVEALTEALNFGFWHNPGESIEFLKRVIERGGCRALETPQTFVEELLTRRERAELTERDTELVAVYYLGLLRASASYLDGETFTRLRAEIEPLRDRLPFFVLPGDPVAAETA